MQDNDNDIEIEEKKSIPELEHPPQEEDLLAADRTPRPNFNSKE